MKSVMPLPAEVPAVDAVAAAAGKYIFGLDGYMGEFSHDERFNAALAEVKSQF